MQLSYAFLNWMLFNIAIIHSFALFSLAYFYTHIWGNWLNGVGWGWQRPRQPARLKMLSTDPSVSIGWMCLPMIGTYSQIAIRLVLSDCLNFISPFWDIQQETIGLLWMTKIWVLCLFCKIIGSRILKCHSAKEWIVARWPSQSKRTAVLARSPLKIHIKESRDLSWRMGLSTLPRERTQIWAVQRVSKKCAEELQWVRRARN